MAHRIASFPAIALLLAATPALAVDFTINVPVTIENVPAARRVSVNCGIYDTPPGTGHREINVIGTGSSDRTPVSNGNFSGTLTAAINATSPRTPAQAQSYGCTIDLEGVTSDGREIRVSYQTLVRDWAANTGQTITIPNTSVSGAIPR